MRHLLLVTLGLALTLGCSRSNNTAGPDPREGAAIDVAVGWVDDLVDAAGASDTDARADTLYRFGQRLEAGDVVYTGFEQEPITMDGATWMFWHDPQPVLRYEHESTLLFVDDASGELETVEIPAWPVVNGGDRWGANALLIPPDDVVFDHSDLYEELSEDDLEVQTQSLEIRRNGLNVDCVPKRHFLLIYGSPGAQANTMGAEARQITGLMNEDWMGVDRVTVSSTWRDFEGATAAEYRENFRNYLEEWFLSVDCCDEVIVYYIGHGYDEGVGAWGLGTAGDGSFAAIRGSTLGSWIRDIIDFGHGCKFMLINHSCYSAAFNQEVAGEINGDSGTQAERGDMLLEHSSQGDQQTVDNYAGNWLMNGLRSTFGSGDEPPAWDTLRAVVTTAMSGFEADNSKEKGILAKLITNDAGVLGATGRDIERCCPGCGDGIVDDDEDCDGEGTACDDGDPDTIDDTCDDECICEGTPDPGSDEDGDGIDDDEDNCTDVPNPGQEDCNNNDVGDACDGAVAMFADQTNDWILPEMGGQPTGQGIPQLDIEGAVVDLQQTPGAITVIVDLVQDAPPTTPGFSGIDVVYRVQNGGDQSPGLFNGGLVNLRLETEGQGQPYSCAIYRFDDGQQTWQEEPLQNGMLPPGVECTTNGDMITFVFDLAGIGAPVCDLGLSIFTQERRDIDADNNPDLIADWLQPVIQPLPGY